jgi:hypothetical protein
MAFATSVDLPLIAHTSPQRRKDAKKTTQRNAKHEHELPNYWRIAHVKFIRRHFYRRIVSFFFAFPLRLCAFAVKS